MRKLIDNIESIKHFFLCFFCLSLPFSEKISTLTILVLAIISLIDFKNLNNILKFKKIASLLLILYLFYVVAYWRDFYEFNNQAIMRKLSLVAFPMIIFSTKINETQYKDIFKYFVFGCFFSYFFYFSLATFQSFQGEFGFNPIKPDYVGRSDLSQYYINYFLGQSFSNEFHPGYLSCYYLFSIILIWIKQLNIIKKQALKTTMTFFLIIGLFQLGTLLSMFLLFIFLCVVIVKKKYLKFIIPANIIIVAIVGFSFKKTTNLNFNRITIWETTYSVFKENPIIGHGFKTAQRELFYHYPKEGSFGALIQKVKIDAHNQFLQWLIEIGVLGFIFASLILYNFIMIVYSKRLLEGLFFFILIIMYMLIESIFNVYAGISFFTFFYCLIISRAKN